MTTHQTSRFNLLGFDFAVSVPDKILRDYLDVSHASFIRPGKPRHLYSLVENGSTTNERYRIDLDGEAIFSCADPGLLFAYLLWHLTRQVIEGRSSSLLVHAAALELDGTALIFPAHMGSGKTTLAMHLAKSGLGYLTDELAPIDLKSLSILPYPRPIFLDNPPAKYGEDFPWIETEVSSYLTGLVAVDPTWTNDRAILEPCKPREIFFPEYRGEVRCEVIPISEGQALTQLALNVFNLESHGKAGFRALASIANQCRSYRLIMGDVMEACELVIQKATKG